MLNYQRVLGIALGISWTLFRSVGKKDNLNDEVNTWIPKDLMMDVFFTSKYQRRVTKQQWMWMVMMRTMIVITIIVISTMIVTATMITGICSKNLFFYRSSLWNVFCQGKPWRFFDFFEIPSGKHTKNYGKSPCIFHGKSYYFDWAMFNSYVNVYQRIS